MTKKKAVFGGVEQHLALFRQGRGFAIFGFFGPVNLGDNDMLRSGIVPGLGGRFLIMPEIFAGIGVYRNNG